MEEFSIPYFQKAINVQLYNSTSKSCNFPVRGIMMPIKSYGWDMPM